MIRNTAISAALAVFVTWSGTASAADPAHDAGPYIGGSITRSDFNPEVLGLPSVSAEHAGLGGKAYGGYRFNEYVGIEAGYADLGSITGTQVANGATFEQRAKARAYYGAVTGRMPVSEAFALTGKLGVSYGRVRGDSTASAPTDLRGPRRSFMYGLGVEYRVSPRVAVVAEFERFGRVSDNVSASAVSAGIRYWF